MFISSKFTNFVLFIIVFTIVFFFLLQGLLSVDYLVFELQVVESQESSSMCFEHGRSLWFSPGEDFPKTFTCKDGITGPSSFSVAYALFPKGSPIWKLITAHALAVPVAAPAIEVIDYRDLADYLVAGRSPVVTGDYIFVRMYNNTIVKADASMLYGMEILETTDGLFNPNNPLTRMRIRYTKAEEERWGNFVKVSPKTFSEKTWADWFDDNHFFFDILGLGIGIYVAYRWHRWEQGDDSRPWESSDLH